MPVFLVYMWGYSCDIHFKIKMVGEKRKNATLAINYSQLANFHAFNFKRKGKQELKLRTSKLLRNLSLADSTHRSCAL